MGDGGNSRGIVTADARSEKAPPASSILKKDGPELTKLLKNSPEATSQDILVAAFVDAGLLTGTITNYMSWNNGQGVRGDMDYDQVKRILTEGGLSAYLPLFKGLENSPISFKSFSDRIETEARKISKKEDCPCPDIDPLTLAGVIKSSDAKSSVA